jgi:hypothetical protein
MTPTLESLRELVEKWRRLGDKQIKEQLGVMSMAQGHTLLAVADALEAILNRAPSEGGRGLTVEQIHKLADEIETVYSLQNVPDLHAAVEQVLNAALASPETPVPAPRDEQPNTLDAPFWKWWEASGFLPGCSLVAHAAWKASRGKS